MEEKTTKDDGGRLSLVVLFPLIVAFSKHQPGLVIGWSAVLPKIQADNSTTLDVTDTDVKWLVSLTGIAGMAGALATGPIIEFLGPRRFLLWIHLPNAIFWLMKAFTPYISLLYFGRIGLSTMLSMLGPLIPMLISEISDPKIRGFTLSMEENVVATSSLIMYVLAQKLHWKIATALCAVPSVLLFIACLFLPESPYWLARNGQLEKAKLSLLKLRSSKADAIEELTHLTTNLENQPQTGILDQVKQMKHYRNFRPVLLLLAIFILREIGGEYVVFNYTVYIFEEAGVDIDPFTCTIMVGITRTIFTIACSLLVDRVGRRPLFIATTLVCSLSAAVCGGFFVIDNSGTWVPLGALLVYVASYGLGLGPIPWGLTGEMIPTPVRSIGGPICIFGYSLTIFVMGYLFPVMIDSIGIGISFLIFSVSLLFLTLILCLWFPETKGKTLNDLQDTFQRKKKGKESSSPVSDTSSKDVQKLPSTE